MIRGALYLILFLGVVVAFGASVELRKPTEVSVICPRVVNAVATITMVPSGDHWYCQGCKKWHAIDETFVDRHPAIRE